MHDVRDAGTQQSEQHLQQAAPHFSSWLSARSAHAPVTRRNPMACRQRLQRRFLTVVSMPCTAAAPSQKRWSQVAKRAVG